jgi:hypothetical protein
VWLPWKKWICEKMTAPTPAVFTVFPLGPGQVTDNLTGLANNSALGLGIIGTANVDSKDIKIGSVLITTGTVPLSPNGTGTASLYLAIGEDGVNFTDGLNPNSSNAAQESSKFVTSQSLPLMLVQRIACPASATQYRFNAFSVLQKLNYVPTFVGLYVVNNTGAQFSTVAAGFVAGFKLISFN